MPVPHLATRLTGPLLALESSILKAQAEVESWLRQEWLAHEVPFYGSVDLRNAGFKLAPVDMNLFPGGFNNLNPDFLPLCIQAAQTAIEKWCPVACRALLIPENHTRNLYYLENVAALAHILRLSGLDLRIGSLNPEITAPTELELPSSGAHLLLEPVIRQGGRIGVAGFDPCLVLLNNDLSAGIPAVLHGVEQSVVPPPKLGWHARRKTRHFQHYDAVAQAFANKVGVDPWTINPIFTAVDQIDFQQKQGVEQLADAVSQVLTQTARKYAEWKVDTAPYVFVKADTGTYGMGVMSVHSPDEVLELNRRQRNKMSVIKEGQSVSGVIVQEGVPTVETVEGAVAEPVVYMIERFVVGGFYRLHRERGIDDNLNTPGAAFEPLAFATPCLTPDRSGSPDCAPNRFYAYGVVARLALLAAAKEHADLHSTEPAEASLALRAGAA